MKLLRENICMSASALSLKWWVGGWVAGEVCLGNDAQNLRDQIIAVLRLLETTEGHLGAGDVLLGVLEVVEL